MPMTCQFETANGMLVVNGSLDRAADSDFTSALEKYCQETPADKRCVDMTQVRWLAPTGAKVLIQFAQETLDRNGKLRVLASRHVFQTLNLLGAKSWMNIEVMHLSRQISTLQPAQASAAHAEAPASLSAPEAPQAEAPAASEPESGGETFGSSDLSLDMDLLGGMTSSAPAASSAPVTPAASTPGASGGASIGFIPPALPRTVPAPKHGGSTSSALPAVRPGASAPAAAASAPTILAGPLEDLAGAAHLLRVLQPGRRYIFHFGLGEGFTCIVKERLGGPWIIVDVDGVKKWVNLELLATCEPL
jgi:anti-anti-sigma factor